MCLRPVAATLSKQGGAGFGSWLARDTLTDSTESYYGAFKFFAPEQDKVLFQYLDILGSLWEKSTSSEHLDYLESAVPRVMSELAWLLPSWELDINRHMMLHLVASIRADGPCWSWSMFGFERLWGRLIRWMRQKSRPEATMLNAFRAFTKACVALPHEMSTLQVSMTEPSHSFGVQTTPFYQVPKTLDEATFELQLPEFMQEHELCPSACLISSRLSV